MCGQPRPILSLSISFGSRFKILLRVCLSRGCRFALYTKVPVLQRRTDPIHLWLLVMWCVIVVVVDDEVDTKRVGHRIHPTKKAPRHPPHRSFKCVRGLEVVGIKRQRWWI